MSIVDVLVIGAGQAGLALAWHLRGLPLRVRLLDRAARVGDSWRARYESLTLFSPRALSALPGAPLPGPQGGYPTKDEVADYLEAYARRVPAEIVLRAGVRRLSVEDGLFVAETDAGERHRGRAAVVATGAFQEPIVPSFAARLSPEVAQRTAATYRSSAHLPGARVLVAGDGATGRQIALELAGERRVLLATGRRRLVTGRRLLGRDPLWWGDRLGLVHAPRDSLAGRAMRRLDAFPGEHLRLGRLRRRGVEVTGRVVGAEGHRVILARGREIAVDAVVWAVGYRERSEWIAIAGARDPSGRPLERRGVSPVAGLYHVGRDWQWSRGSGLLCGVGRDAAFVARAIAARAGAVPAPLAGAAAPAPLPP